MAEIEIVPFTLLHAAGVIAVILPIQQSEFGIPITLDSQPDLQNIREYYQRDDGNFWVALHGMKVVGTAALLDIGGRQGALRKMFVSAEYRGRDYGVAKRLLDSLLMWCKERSINQVYLGTTGKFLAAHRFYEKNGFLEILRTKLPDTFPVMAVDTKFYVRSL